MTTFDSSVARRALALDKSTIGFLIVDPHSQRIVDANEMACEILGFAPGRLNDTHLGDVSHQDDAAIDATFVAQLLSGTRDSFRNRKRFVTAQGDIIYADIEVRSLRDDSGRDEYHLVQLIESTHRHSAETLLALLADQPDGDTLARALCFGLLRDLVPHVVLIQHIDNESQTLVTDGAIGLDQVQRSYFSGVPLAAHLPISECARNQTELLMNYDDVLSLYPLVSKVIVHSDAPTDLLLCVLPIQSKGITIGVLATVFGGGTATSWKMRRRLTTASSVVATWLACNNRPRHHEKYPTSHQFSSYFTERQRAILKLIAAGLSNREIADELAYSIATIKADARSLMNLLGTNNREDLAEIANTMKLFVD
jgi:PAS domain S-box-containing protein